MGMSAFVVIQYDMFRSPGKEEQGGDGGGGAGRDRLSLVVGD